MTHRSSLHLAALSAHMLLSANFTPASATLNTDFRTGTDDSPTAKKGICHIENDATNDGGGAVEDDNSGEGTSAALIGDDDTGEQQQAQQAGGAQQLDETAAVPKAEPGTEGQPT